MKKITCEMCGSTEFVKKDGFMECQGCGTKYTVEEAKKLMIEGTVDVSGSTVKVDNTSMVTNYLENARRARRKEDWEEIEKYYNLVEQYDASNIEAIFYSAYGKAKQLLLENNQLKREDAFRVLRNSISIIDDNYKKEDGEANKEIILQISEDLFKMDQSAFIYQASTKNVNIGNFDIPITTDNKNATTALFKSLHIGFIDSLNNIIEKYDESEKDKVIYLFELIEIHSFKAGVKYDMEKHIDSKFPTDAYNRAINLFNENKFEEALQIFKHITGYKDVMSWIGKIPLEVQIKNINDISTYQFDSIIDDNIPYFVFGKYNNIGIEWIILSRDDISICVVSRFVLDFKQFHNCLTDDLEFEKADINRWLNNDFYNMSFSDEEKEKILLIGENNDKKITLLDIEKASLFEFDGGSVIGSIVKMFSSDQTSYRKKTIAINKDPNIQNFDFCPYWISNISKRYDNDSPNFSAVYVSFYDENGVYDNTKDLTKTLGVRPCMWLKIKSDDQA